MVGWRYFIATSYLMSSSIQLTPDRLKRVQRVRQLAKLLDESITIPGINKKIGLDPIIGMIPGGGDTLTMLFSAYIVVESARLGIPKGTLAQMVVNIVVDALAGTVPVVGDLFDVVTKANMRNIKLMDVHLADPDFQVKPNKLLIIGIVAILAVIIVSFGAVMVLIYSLLKSLI
jgi:Domain of unknown function (DUF4112)